MRTVQTYVSKQALEALLQLPDGVEVRQMHYDFEADCIRIRLQSDAFPDVQHNEGAIINDPFVLAEIHGKTITWVFPKDEAK